MSLYDSKLYLEDIGYAASLDLPWERMKDKSIVLSGATGLIGSFLIDFIMRKNEIDALNCTIYAIGRNKGKAEERFGSRIDNSHFHFIEQDINEPLNVDVDNVDYVLHLASNVHPVQYATDPIGTITTNILGLQNMLEFASSHKSKRFLFTSSCEIYGKNRGDVELFDENYCGYINCNTVRACYNESKRCGESLCQAYKSQKGLDVCIARLSRTIGPTMLMSDTKASSQFIKNGIVGEDIILKSEGKQYYSYSYVSDAVSGLLYILLEGKNGEAYNIADDSGDITLKDFASTVASFIGQKVIFELPDAVEASGYSPATKARLDGRKLQTLGWKPQYDIRAGIKRTIEILRSIQ